MTYPIPLTNVPRPGSLAFAETWADTTGSGLTVGITNDTPPRLSGPVSTWKAFDLPGEAGQGLIGWPNQYLVSTGASLFYNIPSNGSAGQITTSQTFSKNGVISLAAIMTASFPDVTLPSSAGGGIILYDGENGNDTGADTYAGMYFFPLSTTQVGVLFLTSVAPTWVLPVVMAPWTAQALRIDYVAPGIPGVSDGATQGTTLFYLANQLMFSTTRITFTDDPHAALFLSGYGNVGRVDVYTQ